MSYLAKNASAAEGVRSLGRIIQSYIQSPATRKEIHYRIKKHMTDAARKASAAGKDLKSKVIK